MLFTDTHIHLYADEFSADCEMLIKHAFNKGVQRLFMPNIDVDSIDPMNALNDLYPMQCFSMMGLHPCYVKENYKEQLDVIKQHLFSGKRKYVAVGEIGVDLFWDKTFADQQIEAFKIQIEWALELNLPIVIHTRNSFDETYNALVEVKNATGNLPKGIFHCFSGSFEQAQKVLQLKSFKLGIGGVLTYKNSGLDKAIENIDLAHLVLETDGPYLPPTPHRGKRNEPEYITLIARKLADVKNVSIETIADVTTKNSVDIFGV